MSRRTSRCQWFSQLFTGPIRIGIRYGSAFILLAAARGAAYTNNATSTNAVIHFNQTTLATTAETTYLPEEKELCVPSPTFVYPSSDIILTDISGEIKRNLSSKEFVKALQETEQEGLALNTTTVAKHPAYYAQDRQLRVLTKLLSGLPTETRDGIISNQLWPPALKDDDAIMVKMLMARNYQPSSNLVVDYLPRDPNIIIAILQKWPDLFHDTMITTAVANRDYNMTKTLLPYSKNISDIFSDSEAYQKHLDRMNGLDSPPIEISTKENNLLMFARGNIVSLFINHPDFSNQHRLYALKKALANKGGAYPTREYPDSVQLLILDCMNRNINIDKLAPLIPSEKIISIYFEKLFSLHILDTLSFRWWMVRPHVQYVLSNAILLILEATITMLLFLSASLARSEVNNWLTTRRLINIINTVASIPPEFEDYIQQLINENDTIREFFDILTTEILWPCILMNDRCSYRLTKDHINAYFYNKLKGNNAIILDCSKTPYNVNANEGIRWFLERIIRLDAELNSRNKSDFIKMLDDLMQRIPHLNNPNAWHLDSKTKKSLKRPWTNAETGFSTNLTEDAALETKENTFTSQSGTLFYRNKMLEELIEKRGELASKHKERISPPLLEFIKTHLEKDKTVEEKQSTESKTAAM